MKRLPTAGALPRTMIRIDLEAQRPALLPTASSWRIPRGNVPEFHGGLASKVHTEAALERIEYRFSWKGKGLTNDDGLPEALENGSQIGTTILKISCRHLVPYRSQARAPRLACRCRCTPLSCNRCRQPRD